jgi:hypothetical protein
VALSLEHAAEADADERMIVGQYYGRHGRAPAQQSGPGPVIGPTV